MRTLNIAALLAIGLLTSATFAQSDATPVAQVFTIAIECRDLDAQEPPGCASALLRYVRSKVGERFVAAHGLQATSAELERLVAYNRAFERQDRAQRTRKLAQIEARLADPALVPSDQERLQAFRAVLLRMAKHDADLDAGLEAREPIEERTLRGWIEAAKLNAALYAKYGGSIGVTASGLYAHGAMHALIKEHIERGEVRIFDATVEERFLAALRAPPRLTHVGGAPDFTPFWERPIPPSYLPD